MTVTDLPGGLIIELDLELEPSRELKPEGEKPLELPSARPQSDTDNIKNNESYRLLDNNISISGVEH
jgi:hypothetical protein